MVVGRRLRLDGEDHVVIGVLPEAFQFTLLGSVDVWRPLVVMADDATNRNLRSVTGLGRLRAGRTVEQARAELTAHAERLAAGHPETNARRGVRVVSLAEEGAPTDRAVRAAHCALELRLLLPQVPMARRRWASLPTVSRLPALLA